VNPRERWPALMSRDQAAEYLGISPSTLSREKAAGRIRSKVIRGMYMYSREDLDRFIDALPYGEGEFKGKRSTEQEQAC
jgi:excisionase family DNA binding protein